MPNTFFGLSISKSGLYASMAGINATAHNIANTEADGYSRQVVNQKASMAIKVNSSYGMAGSGTDVTGVTQMRSVYYDMKYRENNTIYGSYQTKADYMLEIENYFNEITLEGFTKTYNSFYDSLQDLSKSPENLTNRTQVTNFAQSLCDYFNALSESMKSIQEKCNFEIKNQVDKLNNIGQQIASLTKQINTMEVNGGAANDLRDQRNLLIDKLTQICNVSVTEDVVGDGVGITSYLVKIDGRVLVDTYNYNQLVVVPRTDLINQTDVDGLYELTWDNGQTFNSASSALGGALAALFEIRDGNNNEAFRGSADTSTGDTVVRVTGTNVNDVTKLNIPPEGVITVANREYNYAGFQVIEEEDGSYTYEFELVDGQEIAKDSEGGTVIIGKDINYKGIPYYMGQMNEFLRTFSRAFNNVHTSGQDLYGSAGLDFFNAADKVTGKDYVFGQSEDDDADHIIVRSGTGSYTNGEDINYGSYYLMTAENVKVSTAVDSDPKRVAAASSIVDGIANADNVLALIALKSDDSLFKQGTPGAFFQTMVAEIGIDTQKAKQFAQNQENICANITNQRLSVSGVDTEEEGMNLIRYQTVYNLSAHAVTVMNQIYDKLINYMGV